MNVLMPMAGEGSRLKGFQGVPKPLININGHPMFMWSLNNIPGTNNFIFIVKDSDAMNYNIHGIIKEKFPESTVIAQQGKVDGAAITTLLVADMIDNDEPLLIVDCDILVNVNYGQLMLMDIDGAVVVSESDFPHYSYAALRKDGSVKKIAEKEVISNNAISGVYYWKKGSDYVKYAKSMIKKNIRTNGEFYIAPVYNEAIKDKKVIVPLFSNFFFHLGTQEEIDKFMKVNNDDAVK